MRLHKVKLSILLTLLLLVFVACEDNSVGVEENSEQLAAVTEYSVMDGADVVEDLTPATTMQDMKWGGNMPEEGKPRFLKERPARMYLGRILKALELSDDQKETLKPVFENHRSLARAVHENFKTEVQPILEEAKTERQAVVTSMKAGEITKAEAAELIRIINEETRAKIEDTEAFANASAELCELKKSLIDDIAAVLNEDQLVKWNEWIADSEDDCLNS